MDQRGGGGDAVHVIIAEDGDRLAVDDGAEETLDGGLHAIEGEGVAEGRGFGA